MELNMKKLGEHLLTPNEYVFLYYLVSPEIHSSLSYVVDFKRLESLGFIKIGEANLSIPRQKAIDLVSEEPYVYKEPATPIDAIEHWITEWRELFPKNVQTGGYPVRGTRGGCIKKMKRFFKTHKGVTKKEVFEATKKYVADKEIINFSYMRLADYFIEKEGGSLLEEYIRQIRDRKPSIAALNVRGNSGDLADDL